MPGPRCSICAHPRRSHIERDWINGRNRRAIAESFGISYRQLNNHYARGHVEREVVAAQQLKSQVKRGERLLDSLDSYRDRIHTGLDLLEELMQRKDAPVGVILSTIREQTSQIREAARLLELKGRVTGEISDAKFNLYIMPAWTEIRDIIFDALEHHPEARLAVLSAVQNKLAARAVQALPPPSEAVEVQAEVIDV